MSTSSPPFLTAPPAKPLSRQRYAIALFAGDLLGLAGVIARSLELPLGQPFNDFDPVFCGVMVFVLTGLYLVDAYRPMSQISGLWVFARIVLSNLAIVGVSSALVYLLGWRPDLLGRDVLLPMGWFTLWAILLRLGAFAWMRLPLRRTASQSQAQQSRWLVVGAGERLHQFTQDFSILNPLGRLIVLTETGIDLEGILPRSLHCVCITDLSRPAWSAQAWSGVIVTTQNELAEAQVRQLMQLRSQGVPVYGLLDFYEAFLYKLPSHLLQESWFVSSSGFNLISSSISLKLKRMIDIMFAIVLLVLLSPVMLIAALAIRLDSPGSVVYSQLRSGLHRQCFKVYKFRSMYQDAEKRGAQWAQEHDPRVTRVGRWLRSMRIDELPQIWNVLRGEMSLIGPRPERPEFDTQLAEAIPYYDVRYWVKPGITGWAQVMYPYGASITDAYEKLAYDLYYLKNHSLGLECAIAFKTIRVVFLGKGR